MPDIQDAGGVFLYTAGATQTKENNYGDNWLSIYFSEA
jgi:hypothetical protein